jgi:hypothetical protein
MNHLSVMRRRGVGVVFVSAVVATVSVVPSVSQACSSCGCTLNSDWSSQGYTVASGLRLDLRGDYYDQDQLRAGRSSADRASIAIPNDEEIQQRTLNRTTILGLDYSPSRVWGVHAELPYFDRFHTTLAEGETDLSTSHAKGIGDLRLTVRYQGFSPDLSWGVQFGLKLPTGSFDDAFIAGPTTGERVDRGLQAGSGTTDLIAGIYTFGNVTSQLGYFAQAMLQQPLNSREEFKPGAGLNLTAGLRYLHAGRWTPQLQLNARIEGRESGAQADRDNSGATLIYASPGLSVALTAKLQSYAFLQLPIYQRVNGLQLEPTKFFTLGMQYKF